MIDRFEKLSDRIKQQTEKPIFVFAHFRFILFSYGNFGYGRRSYIGSAAVKDLREKGETVVVIDSLVYGHTDAIDSSVKFYEGEIGDENLIRKILSEHEIEACMHFSAYAYVGESVEKPQIYYENNFVQTLKLLIFSSKQASKNLFFLRPARRTASRNTFRLTKNIRRVRSILTGRRNLWSKKFCAITIRLMI